MRHELKIFPQYFNRIKEREKTFIVYPVQTAIQNGDDIWIREFDPTIEKKNKKQNPVPKGAFTNRELNCTAGFTMPLNGEMMIISLLNVVDEET